MDSVFSALFNEDLVPVPYKDNEEYISDLVKRVELVLIYFLECAPVQEQHLDPFRGPVITKNQVDDVFRKNESFEENRAMLTRDLDRADFIIRARLEISGLEGARFFSFEYIKNLYQLSDLEAFCLTLSLLPIVDSKYEKVFAYLQDDLNQKTAGYDLAMKLFYFVDDVSQIEDYFNKRKDLEGKLSALCFDEGTTTISARLLSFIMNNGEGELARNDISCFIPGDDNPLPIMEETAYQLANVLRRTDRGQALYFYISGPQGIGKRTQVKRVAEMMTMSMTMVDVAQLDFKNDMNFYNALVTACRETIISQGAICFYNFDVLYPPEDEREGPPQDKDKERFISVILNTAAQYTSVIFVLSKTEKKNRNLMEKYTWFDLQMRYPTKDESIFLWEHCLREVNLKEEIKPYELANKFTFTPGQIVMTTKEASHLALWGKGEAISKREFYECAYNQIVHNLQKQATLIYAQHSWDQLILADEQKEMLKNACDQIRYKHIVYDKWGFNKRLAYGKGVSMLFAGPPGTGKTMAAQVVANELDIEIYKVDLSQIVSKYIGETEKNLNNLFNEAKKSNVILFFDETDALLGKRTEVKDSHDKNANLETSYLLQKMEEYDGITVMSTNYIENIDNAFFRRITYVIHFPFPDVESRKQIWKTIFPKEMPLSKDIDFDYLARQFEIAGGNIKNIAVTAAFLAAKSSNKLTMAHILQAIKYELTKQGKAVLKEDFGEHAYLLKLRG